MDFSTYPTVVGFIGKILPAVTWYFISVTVQVELLIFEHSQGPEIK